MKGPELQKLRIKQILNFWNSSYQEFIAVNISEETEEKK